MAGGDSPVRELLQWRRLFDTKLVEITDYGFAAVTRLKVDDALGAKSKTRLAPGHRGRHRLAGWPARTSA